MAYLKVFAQFMGADALTYRIRACFYSAYVQRSMGWHDRHPTDELAQSLSREAAQARSLYYDCFPAIVMSISTLLTAVGLGLYYAPRFTLVYLIPLPLLVVCLAFDSKTIMGGGDTASHDAVFVDEATHTNMVINNRDIIASHGRLTDFFQEYEAKIKSTERHTLSQVKTLAVASFVSQNVLFSFLAFACYWGMYNVVYLEVDPEDFICSLIPLLNSALVCGLALQWLPNKAEALGLLTHGASQP